MRRKVCRECGRDYEGPAGTAEWRGLVVDLGERTAICRGRAFRLSKMRSRFLFMLLEAAGNEVPIWRFVQEVGGADPSETVRTHISYLRRGLEGAACPFTVHHAGRGRGYYLRFAGA